LDVAVDLTSGAGESFSALSPLLIERQDGHGPDVESIRRLATVRPQFDAASSDRRGRRCMVAYSGRRSRAAAITC